MPPEPSSNGRDVDVKRLGLWFALAVLVMGRQTGWSGGVIAWWAFDEDMDQKVRDRARPVEDVIEDHYRLVPGVKGTALLLDGYTTCIVRDADHAPSLGRHFTMTVWIAEAAYPWNWCPIVTQAEGQSRGYSLEVGPRGNVRLSLAVDGQWRTCTSGDFVIGLRQWAHVAACFEEDKGIQLYVNGESVGDLAIQGTPDYAEGTHVRLGMNYEPQKPSDIHREHGTLPGWFSIDGILDELKIYDSVLGSEDIAKTVRAQMPTSDPPLQPRVLPAGPKGPGPFGAFYCHLKYYDEWDNLWAVDADSDVIVRFDASPVRVVFWRGSRYSPAWVSENDQWMADQSVEAWGVGEGDKEGCFEHMQDRRCRYSHVRIIESHDARAVVHWRYALVSAHDHLWREHPKTGRACWVDEYYFIYPDQMGVRKPTWKTGTLGHPRQFQESLPFTGCGQLQSDVIHEQFATVGNLEGQTATLAFVENPKEVKAGLPDDLVIQQYNFKADNKPFIIFEPGNRMHYVRDRKLGPRGLDVPGACNHWPVGQARCDGRTVQAADRPTHFLGFPISSPPVHEKDGRSWWNGLYGMTHRTVKDLVPVARSWARPPTLKITAAGFSDQGYDRSQRAYRVQRHTTAVDAALTLELEASKESPVFNPVFVIQDWPDGGVRLHVNGNETPRGKTFRVGERHRLDGGMDLICWIQYESATPVTIQLRPGD